MTWLLTKNNEAVAIKDLPILTMSAWRLALTSALQQGDRLVSIWAVKIDRKIILYTVLADDQLPCLKINTTVTTSTESYCSLATEFPTLQLWEREIYEETGLCPENHPWLKPVRYPHNSPTKLDMATYPFYQMAGYQIHEVGVGPVHAGVIEPGHFRFMCNGERAFHLEIQLGYQHRGVEQLMQAGSIFGKQVLAESIAGDTVLGHGLAYMHALETLTQTAVPARAQKIRVIALEMERVAMHLADLSALANDIAYQTGAAVFGANRPWVIKSLLAICGSRFGRALLALGGVNFDIEATLTSELDKTLSMVLANTEQMGEMMFTAPDVLARFEQTGVINLATAQEIGLTGLAARASGLSVDARSDQPFGWYQHIQHEKIVLQSGDVYARAYLRFLEIQQSLRLVLHEIRTLPMTSLKATVTPSLPAETLVVSLTEGWRGEIMHALLTDTQGHVQRYKIQDPSFRNWFGLAQAVRNNDISDFPICNKSFNLSYCGHDL